MATWESGEALDAVVRERPPFLAAEVRDAGDLPLELEARELEDLKLVEHPIPFRALD